MLVLGRKSTSQKTIAAVVVSLGNFVGMQSAVADNNLFKSYAYDTPVASCTDAVGLIFSSDK
jgi:hypothetical protein